MLRPVQRGGLGFPCFCLFPESRCMVDLEPGLCVLALVPIGGPAVSLLWGFSGVSLGFSGFLCGFSAVSLGYRNRREIPEKPQRNHRETPEKPRETQRNPREEKPPPPLLNQAPCDNPAWPRSGARAPIYGMRIWLWYTMELWRYVATAHKTHNSQRPKYKQKRLRTMAPIDIMRP